MITRFFVTFALLVVMAIPTVACEGNAALQYWKAFAVLPELSAEQSDAIKDALAGGQVSDELKELVKKSESALHELAKGAASDECEWGVSMEEGVDAILPHLAKARQLARVACLRAKISFEAGDTEAAIDDIVNVMTLGRDGGQDGVLVALLVDYAIERTAIDTVNGAVASLDADERKALVAAFESLPEAPTVRDAILAENKMFTPWLIATLGKSGGKRTLISLFSGSDTDGVKTIRAASREELLASAKQLPKFNERLADLATLPQDKIEKAEKRLFANPGIDGPAKALALALAPAVTAARQAEADHQARLANLMEALGK